MRLGKVGKISLGWAIITACGVYGFVLSKRSVEAHRYESMKVRERMRKANEGEYDPSYRKFTG
ncbi:uncharacterized protein [Anabrus simplex]|uniref:uncharacterized protein n=1 Tax=Anabrus simplex TaxID=316456 RepID=UPI0034DDA76A